MGRTSSGIMAAFSRYGLRAVIVVGRHREVARKRRQLPGAVFKLGLGTGATGRGRRQALDQGLQLCDSVSEGHAAEGGYTGRKSTRLKSRYSCAAPLASYPETK